MLRPATGESTTPRMALSPGVAGPPGRGGSNGGVVAATGVGSAPGGDPQGDAAAAVGVGGLGAGLAAAIGKRRTSYPPFFAGFLELGSLSGACTTAGCAFAAAAAVGCVLSAGTSEPAVGADACDLSCPSSERTRSSMH